MADQDGAVRDQQNREGEEGTEAERLGAAQAAPDLPRDAGRRGWGWRHTRPPPASSSAEKPAGGWRAGERHWQPRGGERGGRCGSAPG